MQILRTDWRGEGKWRKVCEALNAIGRAINEMIGENGVEVSYHGGRLRIAAETGGGGGSSFPWNKIAFGYRLDVTRPAEEAPYTRCFINPGSIRFHGVGIWQYLGGESVTLDPMTLPWVYAQMPREGGAIGIMASSEEPASNASTFKRPLVQCARTAGGLYELYLVRHFGDFNGDTPLL
jgi:hypothetical protein